MTISPVSSSVSSHGTRGQGSAPAEDVSAYAQHLQNHQAPASESTASSRTHDIHAASTANPVRGDAIFKSFTQPSTQATSGIRGVNVVPPQALTSSERVNGRPVLTGPEGGIGAPDTPGNALNDVLESVQAKTSEYENKFDAAAAGGKNEYGPVDGEKEALQPTIASLGGSNGQTKATNDSVNGQIDRYMGMMREGYEYYIFTSMTIDVGKDVSQTANSLTKG